MKLEDLTDGQIQLALANSNIGADLGSEITIRLAERRAMITKAEYIIAQSGHSQTTQGAKALAAMLIMEACDRVRDL